MRDDVEIGEGEERRRIAVLSRPGAPAPVIWFGGFRSDMKATKAEALDAWAAGSGRAYLRFDYSGHGDSDGAFEAGTISRWRDEGVAVVGQRCPAGRPILVGSSMGAWLALLAGLRIRARHPERAPAGYVLIAPAIDFTERLMWDAFSEDAKAALARDGVYRRPSHYADEPYPITRALIEDGRRHLLLDGPIEAGAPVHILQGMMDPDVPWEHALRLVDRLPGDSVQLTLVKDGDHRLSRPEDIDRLIGAVEAMSARTAEAGQRG